MVYSKMSAGSSARGWKLASAEQRLVDAEAIVDLALDETESIEQLELLRLKALVLIAQEQPKQAIETYRILLALIRGQGENLEKSANKVCTLSKFKRCIAARTFPVNNDVLIVGVVSWQVETNYYE